MSCCSSCFKPKDSLLGNQEREAITSLMEYLENPNTDFFNGRPLATLDALSQSNNTWLLKSAALAFNETTEKERQIVSKTSLIPLLRLLSSDDVETQRAAASALGNLACLKENKATIGELNPFNILANLLKSKDDSVLLQVVCVNLTRSDA